MGKRISSKTWAEARTAFCSGTISLRELARRLRIPAGTMLSRARREGWTKAIEAARALVKPTEAPTAALQVTPATAMVQSMKERGEKHRGRVASITERMVEAFARLSEDEQLRRVDELEKTDKTARRTFGLDVASQDTKPMLTLNVLGSVQINEVIEDQ